MSSSSLFTSAASIKLITFDLDDTLWHTSSGISAANAACQSLVDSSLKGSTDDKVIWKVMKRLYAATPSDYYDSSISVDEGFKREPVMLTKLRKDALRSLHVDLSGEGDPQEFADRAFEVWRDARHEAVAENLASKAAETLGKLREAGYMLGGITNGNSEPGEVKGLEGSLDFCVKAEDVGVGKPHPLVYERSLREAREASPGALPGSEEGGWWVHVGDDLVKDCVAS
eukprot:CAMPEP_0182470282 /NCGR_PEP_ID=MMETSP1319-20130603/18430_1 /TAXON_ID=172717 /ORGANISM="Bolidomonas pacifica, Strain RCC208" /LENGTH=227 /DNA_ID=CAMNT_0024670697 /DNA_START=79 /DNA_END=759 /DNA_ORIENTATION=-